MSTGTMSPATRTTDQRFILEGKMVVPVCLHAFTVWMQLADPVIARSTNAQHDAVTIFTGIKDESGCLFQTTVIRNDRAMDHFREPTIDFVATWRTYDEAMRGHGIICRRI